jgi:hypothetical protein
VSGIKVKLKRKIDVRGWDPNLQYVTQKGKLHFSDYIASHKFEGCKANEKVERFLELEIPVS